jgi:hypothetical protein
LKAGKILYCAGLATIAVAGTLGWWRSRPRAPVPRVETDSASVSDDVELLARRAVGPAPVATTSIDPERAPEISPFAALNAQAILALENGEHERSIELFEQCVAGEPDRAVFRRNLAEALVRRALHERERVRPCEPCLAWLERALELAPDRKEIRTLIERWRNEAEAEKGFVRDRSVHFELSYDGWREALLDSAPDVLEQLERHYIDLAELFGIHPGEGGSKIPVVLYRTEQFSSITGLDWAGASYDGTIRVPIADAKPPGAATPAPGTPAAAPLAAELSDLLRHELIHAFVREAGGPKVPAWLNEGLAQLLQSTSESDLELARATLKNHDLIRWSDLTAGFAKLGDVERIAVAYAQSLLVCRHLDRTYGRETLIRMVRASRDSTIPAAFESWTRVSLETALRDFEEELR